MMLFLFIKLMVETNFLKKVKNQNKVKLQKFYTNNQEEKYNLEEKNIIGNKRNISLHLKEVNMVRNLQDDKNKKYILINNYYI